MGKNNRLIKKDKITISLLVEVNNQLNKLKINKSKLINMLLTQYFN